MIALQVFECVFRICSNAIPGNSWLGAKYVGRLGYVKCLQKFYKMDVTI